MANLILKFRGKTYVVPETRAFELGAEVEEVVTLSEIASWGNNPRFFKIARAFGVMLRFAGARVSDTEVKDEIDASVAGAVAAGAAQMAAKELFAAVAVQQLAAILFKGAPEETGDAAPGKATASSRPRSKSRSRNSA